MKPDTYKRIKENLSLLDYARKQGLSLIRKSDDHYVSLCCFHREDTPSLHFTRRSRGWRFKCFGCGASGGDVINFYQILKGLEGARQSEVVKQMIKEMPELLESQSTGFKQALSKIASRVEAITEGYQERPTVDVYEALIDHCSLSDEAREYLKGRGFTDETINHFKIRSIDDYKKTRAFLEKTFSLDRLKQSTLIIGKKNAFKFIRHTILIPVVNDGEVVGISGRYFYKGSAKCESGNKYRHTKGINQYLFNEDLLKQLRPGAPLYFTEGQFKAMALCQLGINAVASCGVGMWNEMLIRKLNPYELFVVFDNDDAGDRGGKKALKIYKEQTQRMGNLVSFPKQYKGIDDYIFSEEYKNRHLPNMAQ